MKILIELDDGTIVKADEIQAFNTYPSCNLLMGTVGNFILKRSEVERIEKEITEKIGIKFVLLNLPGLKLHQINKEAVNENTNINQ